jgi:hypothetical protein
LESFVRELAKEGRGFPRSWKGDRQARRGIYSENGYFSKDLEMLGGKAEATLPTR